jgi:hypothetical protein
MVRCTFISESREWDGVVDHEVFRVTEDCPQHACRGGRLKGAMEMRGEVCRRQMKAAVSRVRGRADGGGVGRPHRRGGRYVFKQLRRGAPGGGHNFGVRSGKAHLAKARHMRPLVRRQHGLRKPHRHQRAHLSEALQRRLAWVGDQLLVRRRSQVAARQSAVIVRGPHEAVKIYFNSVHGLTPTIGSSSRTTPGEIRLAIGQAA